MIQDGDESSPILTSFEIVKVPDPQMSMVSHCQISKEICFLQTDYDLHPHHTLSKKCICNFIGYLKMNHKFTSAIWNQIQMEYLQEILP